MTRRGFQANGFRELKKKDKCCIPQLESKLTPVVLIGTLIVAGVGLSFFALHPFSSSDGDGGSSKSGIVCAAYSTTFTIIADQNGFNKSIGHGAPKKNWPILCVHAGDLVSITVKNVDNVEPHGFAVTHYYEGGISVLPGNSITITFLANRQGTFSIFCNVICAIHLYMLSGLLVVTG